MFGVRIMSVMVVFHLIVTGLLAAPEMDKEKLRILQWNCRSLNSNLHYLIQKLNHTVYQILCIQSPNCLRRKLPKIEGYYYPPVTEEIKNSDGKVQTATYIKINIIHEMLPPPVPTHPDQPIYSNLVNVTFLTKKVKILNLYAPNSIHPDGLTWMSALDRGGWVVAGDFNIHHFLWSKIPNGVSPATKQATKQAQAIMDSDLILLNNGDFTRLPDRDTHSPTAIDLTLVSPDLYPDIEWNIEDDSLGSDHLPLSIELEVAGRASRAPPAIPKFLYDKADWNAFQKYIQNNYKETNSLDINELCDKLTSLILAAANAAIPRSRGAPEGKPSNPWWTPECDLAVKNKKKMQRIWKKVRNNVNFMNMKGAKINCNKVIATAKLHYLQSKIMQEVHNPTDLGRAWKLVKKLKNKYNPSPVPLIHQGVKIDTDIEKVELLASTFAGVSNTLNLPAAEKAYRLSEEIKNDYADPIPDNGLPLNMPFSMVELDITLNNIKTTKTSPGGDEITYVMLKQLPMEGKEALLKLFNQCYTTDILPAAWQHGIIIPILKPQKPRNQATSFRPVTLTSHISKVMEKLVKARLEYYLEKKNIIPTVQAGFRKHRSCADQLYNLSASIKMAFKKKRRVLACFFDVKRAFDLVWHRKLLQKIKQLHLTGHFYSYVKNFLARTLQVRLNNTYSSTYTTDCGVPQGTCLAPTLFNIMMADLPEILTKIKHKNGNSPIQISQYADDIAIWQSIKMMKIKNLNDNNRASAVRDFQGTVDRIQDYMFENGFSLSHEKTQLILFSWVTCQYNLELTLRVDGVRRPLTFCRRIKFLGVVFSSTLSWTPHLENLVKKAQSAINLIKTIKGETWGNNTKLLLTLHQALVRSNISYGQECFYSASNSSLNNLESTEMRSLKYIFGLPSSTNNMATYALAGLLPLDLYRMQLCSMYTIRLHMVQNNAQEAYKVELAEHKKKNKIKHVPTLPAFTDEVMVAANINPAMVAQVPIPSRPPWTLLAGSVNTEIPSISKKDNVYTQKSVTMDYLDLKYPTALMVYTDGSKIMDGEAGGGFYIPQLQKSAFFSIAGDCCAHTAELVAIVSALRHLLALPLWARQIVLCSDSRAALQAITADKFQSRLEIVLEIKSIIHQLIVSGLEIVLQWIPGHAGIPGNDHVDSLAKMGALRAPGSTSVHILPAVVELRIKVKKAVKDLQDARFHQLGGRHTSTPIFQFKSSSIAKILPHADPLIYRLFTNSWRAKYSRPTCLCGEDFTPDHALFVCPEFSEDCETIRSAHPGGTTLSESLRPDSLIINQIISSVRGGRLAPLI